MNNVHAVRLRVGLPGLDESIGTFMPGDLIVVASRPGIGRTALATFIAGSVAIEQSHAVAFFSLDLTAEQLTQRFLAARGRLSLARLARGCLSDNDYEGLMHADSELRLAPIYIDESSALDTVQLRARVEDLVSTFGIRLVIVDGLEHMSMTETGAPFDAARLLRELKAMARELRLPLLVLTRTRDGRVPEDVRPTVSELADPALAELADVLLLLHRGMGESDVGAQGRQRAEIVVARDNRRPPAVVGAYFLPACAGFERAAR